MVSLDGIAKLIKGELEEMQTRMFESAKSFVHEMTTRVDSKEEFEKVLAEKGGFIEAHWDGTAETEEQIKTLTGATIRCIPLNVKQENGIDPFSGKPSANRAIFAKAY